MTARFLSLADLDAGAIPIDGDLVQFVDDHWYRTRVWPSTDTSWNLVIPLSVTRKHADPFSYFEDAIVAALHRASLESITLVVLPSAYPVSVPCFQVRRHYTRDCRRLAFDFERDGFRGVNSSGWLDETCAAERAVKAYEKSKRPLAMIELLVDQTTVPLADGWTPPYQNQCAGPARHAREQMALLAKSGIPARLVEIDRHADSKWFRGATFRWPFALRMIVRTTLALMPLDLPAYVMLWIFDWLTPLHLWSDLKKVSLIESVIESVRRVRTQRIK